MDAAGRATLPLGFEPSEDIDDSPLDDCVSPSWKAPTSGGSTGRPKLIVAGDGSMYKVTTAGLGALLGGLPGETMVIPGPLYHNGPFIWTFLSLLAGSHVALLGRFDAEQTLQTIEEHRASAIYLVPTMMQRMWKLPDDGKELPAGETGEVWMRSVGRDTPTYRYIGAEPEERDGWECLGDMGSVDADGYLYLADRRKDMILVGGANIYPAEVEAAINAHSQVGSCVVIGLPDEDKGSLIHAIVQAEDLSEKELLKFLADRLVRYKLPRTFEWTDRPLRDDAGKVRRSAWTALGVTTLVFFLSVIDISAVTVVFPLISEHFDIEKSQLSWIISGYNVTAASGLLLAGRLADSIGRKKVFLPGVAIFGIGSLLCGFTPSLELLIAARVVQAIGGAVVAASSLAVVLPDFPLSKRGTVIGIAGAAGSLGAVAGPALGSLLIELSSWRAIFLINVPLILLVLAVGPKMLHESKDPSATGRIDLLSTPS